jgi:hypothetical protein
MFKGVKDNNKTTEIICIDPFTGDVNMWDWKKEAQWKFLKLENRIPTIYKRFLANCKYNGFEHKFLPINATASVGIKFAHTIKDKTDYENLHKINALISGS